LTQSTTLSPAEQATLLRLARAAIESTTAGLDIPQLQWEEISPSLKRIGSSFVTLSKQGQLRGCIGGLKANSPLAQDVQIHAAAAASRDPRFPPVQPHELEEIEIEISVLSEAKQLLYIDPQDLLDRLEPGKDGVILETGEQRATFLPQVWERVQTSEDFLSLLCQKAQLPSDFWLHNQLEIKTYRVQEFCESEA
jgi:AmmeMemoRadiSam system protein A